MFPPLYSKFSKDNTAYIFITPVLSKVSKELNGYLLNEYTKEKESILPKLYRIFNFSIVVIHILPKPSLF